MQNYHMMLLLQKYAEPVNVVLKQYVASLLFLTQTKYKLRLLKCKLAVKFLFIKLGFEFLCFYILKKRIGPRIFKWYSHKSFKEVKVDEVFSPSVFKQWLRSDQVRLIKAMESAW